MKSTLSFLITLACILPISDAALADGPTSLAINEFMASNGDTLADPQGHYDDWIEIYNVDTQRVDMGGMCLTDDLANPTQWRFPSPTYIEAGNYLLVWADADILDNTNGLHASFKLSVGGEEIGLYASNGVTLIDSISFGSQVEDISYGRFTDGTANWYFMDQPTPGYENITPMSESVYFSRLSGVVTDSFTLKLSNKSNTGQIRYTTNGDEPTSSSTIYNDGSGISVTASSSTRIRARAFQTDRAPGPVRTEAYLAISSSIQDLDSNLPIVVIDTFGAGIIKDRTTKPWAQCYSAFLTPGDDGRTRFSNRPDHVGRSSIRHRGASSYGLGGYRFELQDQFGEDEVASLLGLPKESDWILHRLHYDDSYMRDVLAFQWSNEAGLYAPRTRYFLLYLNTDGGTISSYEGLYALTEQIKQGEDRVDIAKLRPTDNAEPEITGGYILHKEAPGMVVPGDIVINNYVLREPNTITSAQQAWLQNWMDGAFNGSYRNDINPETFLLYQALVEMCKPRDIFSASTYINKDREGKMNMGPLWDFNLSLANPIGDPLPPSGWYNLGNIDRILNDPDGNIEWIDLWFGLRETVFDADKMLADVDYWKAYISEAKTANVGAMKTFISNRVEWVDANIGPRPPVMNINGVQMDRGGYISSGDNLTFSELASVYYTTDGTDPRLPGGDINPNAILSANSGSGPLPVTQADEVVSTEVVSMGASVWKYLYDGSDQGTAWRALAFDDSTWGFGPGQLGFGDGDETTVIRTQPHNYMSAYFRHVFSLTEVTNITDISVEVMFDDGAVVYINGQEAGRRDMPTGTIAYDTPANGDSSDDKVATIDAVDPNFLSEGTNIVAVEVHQLSPASSDISFDLSLTVTRTEGSDSGGGDPVDPGDPIPLTKTTQVKARGWDAGSWGALNEAIFAIGPLTNSLRITEIMYHPENPGEEFIELQNVGPSPVNLNLCKFTDGIEFTFPDMTLNSGEYVLVVETQSLFEVKYGAGLNIAGEYTTGSALDNSGEELVLRDAMGTEIQDFDYRDWYPVTDGRGFSLCVINPSSPDLKQWDRKEGWQTGREHGGSPGAANSTTVADSIVINEILTHTDHIDGDWIELHNTTGASIDIGGWFLSDDINDLKKYQIASETVIPGRGYIVFTQTANFGLASSDPGKRVGFGLSELGESLYLSSGDLDELGGGVSTMEAFGAALNGVTFGRCIKSAVSGYESDFVSMASATRGAANSGPLVPGVVIREIMYNPSDHHDELAEYIELYNRSSSAIPLYDTAYPSNTWKFTKGIEFVFPPAASIPAWGHILMVRTDPDIFRYVHGLSPTIQVYGPYGGELGNSGEKLELSMPGVPEPGGHVPYVRTEQVNYSDGSHPVGEDLWPAEADGVAGNSLNRIFTGRYGNDVYNWQTGTPTAGELNPCWVDIMSTGGSSYLTWDAGWMLESAPKVQGPWTDLPEAISPFEIGLPGDQPVQFFRVREP